MQAMVTLDRLGKTFGEVVAVHDLSFSVGRGEVVGFLGPNGAGKSTTMKMITGYLTPTTGKVTVCGLDLQDNPIGVKSVIGYLPEGAPLYGDMTPRRFLDFVARARGLRGDDRSRKIDRAVSRTQLKSVLDQSIETLSKGFKRRVGLAQAILHDPPVLILDEPTDGLDPNQKHEVRKLIREIAADKAIIISTHILEEVNEVCSRAMIIARGKLLADATPAALEARAESHNAVDLWLKQEVADAEGCQAALAGLAGVVRVDRHEAADAVRFRLIAGVGLSLLEPVQGLLARQGWRAEQLRISAGALDEVFRDLTGGLGGREMRS